MKKQVSPSSAMNSPRHNVSEDPQTILRRSSELSATDELLYNIPIDLVIEIFSRLPLKSIARYRCVSKRWASVLRRSDFTELFFTKSSARPQILFARRKDNEVHFFSTPQPQNLSENVSLIASDHHVSFPVEDSYYISNIVNGLFCISNNRIIEGVKTSEIVSVICNPSTKQSFTLPRKRTDMRRFLGYDPIEKQHKVLAMTIINKRVVDHQILTLRGTGNMTWRLIECDIPHFSPGGACVCINGVLYYIAMVPGSMIVCFDLRSEKFSFIKALEIGMHFATLINFQGKLAYVKSKRPYLVSSTSKSFEMWILEDPEKHEWSNRIFDMPPMCKDAYVRELLKFVGVTDTNEFVFVSFYPSDPFHVYYYHFVKEAITIVEIQGIGAFETACRIFLNHVEDLKLMELF